MKYSGVSAVVCNYPKKPAMRKASGPGPILQSTSNFLSSCPPSAWMGKTVEERDPVSASTSVDAGRSGKDLKKEKKVVCICKRMLKFVPVFWVDIANVD